MRHEIETRDSKNIRSATIYRIGVCSVYISDELFSEYPFQCKTSRLVWNRNDYEIDRTILVKNKSAEHLECSADFIFESERSVKNHHSLSLALIHRFAP